MTDLTENKFKDGQQFFLERVIPGLPAINGFSEKEKQQFYAGFLASCLGAMTSDLGAHMPIAMFKALANVSGEILQEVQQECKNQKTH